MPSPVWWSKASIEDKEQIVRLLNGEASARWPFLGPPVRVQTKERNRAQQRIRVGLPAQQSVERQVRADRKVFVEQYKRVGQFLEWRGSGELPSDIRRCKREGCKTFLLVRQSRPGRVFCSPKCARGHHATLCMRQKIQAARERKLRRLRNALENCRSLPDWKERAARKARVTPNFVAYAVRRGEVQIPKTGGHT
jgi:hypothetical protein